MMQPELLRRVRRRLLCPAGILLLVLTAALVILVPAEAQLGSLIKLVYVHGALVIAGLAAFSLAGLLGLVAIATRKPVWFRGADSAGRGALLVWVVCVLTAMAVTKLAWGQLIAWNEPRVRVTAVILGAAVVLELAIRLVGHRDFGAAVRVVIGTTAWLAAHQAEAIRHPVDPVGSSGSTSLQAFFFLMLLAVGCLVLDLLAWYWVESELRSAHAGGHVQA